MYSFEIEGKRVSNQAYEDLKKDIQGGILIPSLRHRYYIVFLLKCIPS